MGTAGRRSDDPLDLTAVEAVLRVLAGADGPLTALEVARASALSTLTVIPILDRLARQRSVTRTPTDPGHGRPPGWGYQLVAPRRGRTSTASIDERSRR